MNAIAESRRNFILPPRWVHLLAWGSLLLLTLGLALLFFALKDSAVWDSLAPSREFENPAYAEAIHANSIFRTRVNTWSNLAYVLPGLYAIALGLWDLRHRRGSAAPYAVRQPALPMLYGVACCYLGLGSGIFHASLTRWGQQLDVAAMYSPLVVLVAIHFARWIPSLRTGKGAWPTWPIFAVACVIVSALLYIYKWELSSTRVMATLMLLILAGCILDAVAGRFVLQWRWVVAAFFGFVIAYAFRAADVADRFTGPDSWLQGHALWHLFTGLSLGAMILFYRTERRAGAE